MKKIILMFTILIMTISSCKKLDDENTNPNQQSLKDRKNLRIGSDNVAYWMDFDFQSGYSSCYWNYEYTRDVPITVYAHCSNQGSEAVKKIFKFWCGAPTIQQPNFYSVISVDGNSTHSDKTVSWTTPTLQPGQSANFTFQIIKLSSQSTSQWEGNFEMSEAVGDYQNEYLYLTYSPPCR